MEYGVIAVAKAMMQEYVQYAIIMELLFMMKPRTMIVMLLYALLMDAELATVLHTSGEIIQIM